MYNVCYTVIQIQTIHNLFSFQKSKTNIIRSHPAFEASYREKKLQDKLPVCVEVPVTCNFYRKCRKTPKTKHISIHTSIWYYTLENITDLKIQVLNFRATQDCAKIFLGFNRTPMLELQECFCGTQSIILQRGKLPFLSFFC